MNKLWAPWRINYVSKVKKRGCIFCHALKDNNDKRNFIIKRSAYCYAILNTFPYNNGHLMVVPKRHISAFDGLSDKEVLAINNMLVEMISVLKRVLRPEGFNLGINLGKVSGAGVDTHLHVHLVPRWLGDTNFMPILSNTKIISQSLKELYIKVKKELS